AAAGARRAAARAGGGGRPRCRGCLCAQCQARAAPARAQPAAHQRAGGGGQMNELSVGLFVVGLIFGLVSIPLALAVARLFSLYVIVREGESVVYELFGNVRLTLKEP